MVTTPIPEVLAYFTLPRRSQPPWELRLVGSREKLVERVLTSRCARRKPFCDDSEIGVCVLRWNLDFDHSVEDFPLRGVDSDTLADQSHE